MIKLWKGRRKKSDHVETWDILSYGTATASTNFQVSPELFDDELNSIQLTKPMQLCFINDLPSDDEDDRSEATVKDTTQSETPIGSEDESQSKYLESDEEHAYVEFDKNGDLDLRKDSTDFIDSLVGSNELIEETPQETDKLLKESSPDFPEEPDGLTALFQRIKSDRVLKHGEYRSLMVDCIFEEPKQIQPPPKSNTPPPRPMSESDADLYMTKKNEDGSEDFLSRQARLQAEARMALAQVRPMAHMQLEVEKQSRKKSPMAEMVNVVYVGIPGFNSTGQRKKLTKGLMFDMNIAQLQVLVNDLHSQIETLNEELVTMLVERDDLHMEQDSMLVDIEDLTRYVSSSQPLHFSLRRAQVEYAQKLSDQKIQKRQAKRNNSSSSTVTPASAASSRKK